MIKMDSNIFDLIKKANETTLKKHGNEISLERAIFLSWWCDKGDCAFCYMSTQKDKIKDAFKKIYRSHLSRDLEQGESAVISVAIPILLWRVQSKSFKEIISLRYSYITQNEERRNIERKLNQGLIRNVEATKLINDLYKAING